MSCLTFINFIVAFVARFILLCACLSALINSIKLIEMSFNILITQVVTLEHEGSTMRQGFQSMAVFLVGLYLVSLALAGAYVSLFSQRRGLNRLLVVSAVTFIACLTVTVTMMPNLRRYEEVTQDKLRAYQPKYDWNGTHPDRAHRDATVVWDFVQENLHCCGFKSPQDWAPFRPPAEPDKWALPMSCCLNSVGLDIQNNGLCGGKMAHWPVGCSRAIHRIMTRLMSLLDSTVNSNLLISFLAALVLLIKCLSENEQQNGGNSYVTTAYGESVVYEPHSFGPVGEAHYYPRLQPDHPDTLHKKYGAHQ